MTPVSPEEKKAELVRGLASACYRQMVVAEQAAAYVANVSKRHGDHPAFMEFMRDLGIEDMRQRTLALLSPKREG
jgi:hypothetical protein